MEKHVKTVVGIYAALEYVCAFLNMCGILALVSLGAAIDCLLGENGGCGAGGSGRRKGGGEAGKDDGGENVPDEVARLLPVLHVCMHTRVFAPALSVRLSPDHAMLCYMLVTCAECGKKYSGKVAT